MNKLRMCLRFLVFVVLLLCSAPFQILGFLIAFGGHGINIGLKHYATLFGALNPARDRK